MVFKKGQSGNPKGRQKKTNRKIAFAQKAFTGVCPIEVNTFS